ncbi:RidA family protein [Phenylobacterium sp.]|uniref:RidA family protein n=1 Tax=Phenylobacterium sp. TaxID=1871053 RepID=UPI002FCC00BF
MTIHDVLLPPGWPRPKGYANGIAAQGRMVFTGGLIGWNAAGDLAGPDIASQFRQLLRNVLAVLAEADAGPEHIVRMTWYILDREEYLANLSELGAIYREEIGKIYPAMAVVEVRGLIEAGARLEIEATAMTPF